MDIVAALHADRGVTCFVGAGGKKTTMYHLAEQLDRAILTNTVRIPIFDTEVEAVYSTDNPVKVIERTDERPIGIVPVKEGDDRYGGFAPEQVDAMADATDDPILVKADGARMRRFKAPGPDEPQIPTRTTTVVPIVSAHVIGEPLDASIVHRVDRVANLTGIEPDEEITPAAIASVITSPDGGHKAVPQDATVIPLINMVDTPALQAQATAVAEAIKSQNNVEQVVLAEMRSESPLVSVR